MIRQVRTIVTKHTQLAKPDPPKVKEIFPDYSVAASTYTFRLPDAECPNSATNHSNPLRFIFESGGVDTFNYQKNLQLFNKYPSTSFPMLKKRSSRPRSVRMLSSDFIEDSLSNPQYGYFPKKAEIFHRDKPFQFNSMANQEDFMDQWAGSYDSYKETTDENSVKPTLQLWHTPTELFQPYYGEALARHILVNYKLNQYPYNDLIIFEMGGGNGTLMQNILDYIERTQPEVYERTQYKIIEISEKMALCQKMQSRHKDKVEIINKSIFEWDTLIPEPCFFIALEVFDNLSHDVLKYDISSGKPYQGHVVIDENGEFKQFFHPELDDWSRLFLEMRKPNYALGHPLNRYNSIFNSTKDALYPLRSNLTSSEFIPTRLVKLLHILKYMFPEHQLIASDFSRLPNATCGYQAPVVQTVLNGQMVTTDTYMVMQGLFDIVFPTDFSLASELYRQIVGKVGKTASHREFLEQWANVDSTTVKNGENPMLDLYQNAAFLYT